MATDTSYEKYYVPDQSAFPVLAALGLFVMVFGMALTLNAVKGGDGAWPSSWVGIFGFGILATVLYNWFSTTIRENHQGMNSAQLKRSYVLGMYWFIFSEVMFFSAFFGALFYVRMWAVPWLGGEGGRAASGMLWEGFQAAWPLVNNPDSSLFPNPGESMEWPGFRAAATYLPLWNTIILMSSSVTVHIAHVALKNNNRKQLKIWLGATVVLAVIFIFLQLEEYFHAYQELGLTMNSGIYGSTFFLLTGFHGFHVTIGAFMLAVMWVRTMKGHFNADDHFGFEAATWYWHFVDVVWVLLFLFVYVL